MGFLKWLSCFCFTAISWHAIRNVFMAAPTLHTLSTLTHSKLRVKTFSAMAHGPSAAECSKLDPVPPSSPKNNYTQMYVYAHMYQQ